MHEENKEGSLGASIASIIVVIVIIVGGVYFWKSFSGKVSSVETETMSTSTEVVDLEADLEAIDIGSLDVE